MTYLSAKCREYNIDEGIFLVGEGKYPIESYLSTNPSFDIKTRKDFKDQIYALKRYGSSGGFVYLVWDLRQRGTTTALTITSHQLKDALSSQEELYTIHKGSRDGKNVEVLFFKEEYLDKFLNTVLLDGEKSTAEDGLETVYREGNRVIHIGTRYERDKKLREAVIKDFKKKHHGKLFCSICGFDFEKVYGELGKDFIEVHHTVPLSDVKNEHDVKVEDMICVCPNCHKMIHHRKPVLTPDELKNAIAKDKELY